MRLYVISIVSFMLIVCSFSLAQNVEIWYGHVDGSPVWARPGEVALIDVYARTQPDVYVFNLGLCLGAWDQYIDSLCSISNGLFYIPISQWDDIMFMAPQHSPPNQAEWSCQAFIGWADVIEPWGNTPMLHSTEPIKILTMAVRVVDDTSIFGDTIACIGPGLVHWGGSNAGDSLGNNYTLIEHFSPLYFTNESQSCEYLSGDINGDSSVNSADVTYGVRYFKGFGDYPPIYCYLDSTGSYFFPAGDVNGNCEFRGSDIVRLVAYFKGIRTLSYCHWLPPSGR
jgi:hypothetical protein